MKLKKKSGLYESSNVTFNPKTLNALSYNWWYFVKSFKGKVVFNDYQYSSTTRRHQCKVKRLLSELGIKIDLTVELTQSLNNIEVENLTLKQLKAKSDAQIASRNEEKRQHRNAMAKARREKAKRDRVAATIKRFADQGIDLLADAKELVDAYNAEQSNVIQLKGA